MDNLLRNAIREYAGSPSDELAHRIARLSLQSEDTGPPILPIAKRIPTPFSSFEDIYEAVLQPITPLSIITEWEDDHVTCGKVEFMVGDKIRWLDLWYAGAAALGSFEYPDSAKAHKVATSVIQDKLAQLFELDNWGDDPADRIADLRSDIAGYDCKVTIPVASHFSRYDLCLYFNAWGQEVFEKVFGPLQPFIWLPTNLAPQHRWKVASHLCITETGATWLYYTGDGPGYGNMDNSRVEEKVPLGRTLMHPLQPRAASDLGCWPF